MYRGIKPQEGTGAPQHYLMCHCEGASRPWQSREGSYVFADGFPVIWSGTARLPRRFAPRNDMSGAVAILTMPCTSRRFTAGPGCPLPYNAPLAALQIINDPLSIFHLLPAGSRYSLSYGCISRNSPGVRPVSLRNALAKAVEDGKPHSAEMCRTVSSVPRSRTLAFASRRRTMRA